MLLAEIKNDVLYHGTSSKRATSILKNGFKLERGGEKSGDSMPGISLTPDLNIANEHAEWAAEEFNDDPVVLVVGAQDLNIMPGKKLYDISEDVFEALKRCQQAGFDGAELFDSSREIGEEEFEVVVFDPQKLKPRLLISTKTTKAGG